MSLELHVFLPTAAVPDRAGWQRAINASGLAIQLPDDLDPRTNTGFVPVKFGQIESGFELYSEPAAELLAVYPHVRPAVADRKWALSFRWGGDLVECGCASVAAAALVAAFQGLAYYPDDDLFYSRSEQLLEQTRECF